MVRSQSAQLRSKAVPEIWDEISNYFGNRSDWKNMAEVLATPRRNSQGQTLTDQRSDHKRLDIDYQYDTYTPSFKHKRDLLKKYLKRKMNKRVPYLGSDHSNSTTASRLMADMLEKENYSALDSLSKIRDKEIKTMRTMSHLSRSDEFGYHVSDEFKYACSFYYQKLIEKLQNGEKLDWRGVRNNIQFMAKKFTSFALNTHHFWYELYLWFEALYHSGLATVISRKRLLWMFATYIAEVKRLNSRYTINDLGEFEGQFSDEEKILVGIDPRNL